MNNLGSVVGEFRGVRKGYTMDYDCYTGVWEYDGILLSECH